jgi:dipeptidyl aminopeptidase/acylaminoacyl peptidase
MGAKKLGPSDLFDLKFVRDACLSPRGHHVAYAISCTENDEERFEIWIGDLRNGEQHRVFFSGNATSPRWSPDGHSIAFVGNNQLHILSYPSLHISEPLTPRHVSVQGAPSWSPDSMRLAVSLQERNVHKGPRRITSNTFRADGLGFLDTLTQHIYEVHRSGDSLRRVTTDAQGYCSQPQWSPCGRRILFFATTDHAHLAGFNFRLLTADLISGEVVTVLGERWSIACARWMPGGERIVVVAARDATLLLPIMSLWTVDRSGENVELRTPNMVATIGSCMHHDMPAWDLTQNSMIAVLDKDIAFATVQKGGSVEIWRISLTGNIAVDSVLTGQRSCLVLDANAASNALLFAVTDLRSPTELWLSTLDDFREKRLTHLNDDVLAAWPALSVERFVFDSADGVAVESWFLALAHPRGPLPTILFIHGGPYGSTGYAFRYDLLMLATQGFGVVFANFRGSMGYGEPFTRAIVGDWGERGYPDHMGTVDAAIKRGLADKDRLGVWGLSHGGFATCWIVGHTDRFKAAVAEAAVTNFTTLYYSTDAPEVFARELGGRPHEIPDVYRARSPMTYAHRCKTPTMLLHGEQDLRCPISEAEQFHRLLQDVGCITELFRIPDCSHLGDSNGPISARRAQNEALLSWFQQHV